MRPQVFLLDSTFGFFSRVPSPFRLSGLSYPLGYLLKRSCISFMTLTDKSQLLDYKQQAKDVYSHRLEAKVAWI